MLIILFFFFTLVTTEDTYCNIENSSLVECSEKNAALSEERLLYTRPIFASRCCFTSSNQCVYMEKTDPYEWISNDYNCFSGVEKCYFKGEVGYKDYSSCYSIPTEQPYSCCYIGNRRKSQCLPINVLKKSVFRQTLHHLRTFFGDFDGDYEVVCQGSFLKNIFLILVFLVF